MANTTLLPVAEYELALKVQLQREADTDLLARLMRGIHSYPLAMGLLATTSFRLEHPGLLVASTAVLLVALAYRCVVFTLGGRVRARFPVLLQWPLAVSVWSCSVVCGGLYASTLWFYGFENWVFTISMLCTAGLASGSTISFTPNFRLLWVHIVLLFVPAIVVGLYRDKEGFTYAIATALMLSFLLLQGYRLHEVYWTHLRNRALETARSAELETAKLAAVAASIAKGRFLANMSHEIRTPMHGIIGMAALAMDADTLAESRESMQVLHRSAEGLLHVLNDILDFSKIEAGKLTLDSVAFPLRQLVDEARGIVAHQASAKDLSLECQISPAIHDHVIGDPARLRQVLINLLGNAVKFTAAGSVILQISEHGERDPAGPMKVEFRVTDTGIGIPQNQQKLIFAAFEQADSTVTRRFGGTGLGLSICFQLVELMGGLLHVESTPGTGSTFAFTIPFQRASIEPASRPIVLPEAIQHLRIMVAEDNLVSQKLAAQLLTRKGHQVIVVSNGNEALRAWEEEDFALIFMDNQMPEMDGVETVRNIREREAQSGRRRTHIVACSASAMAGDREYFLAAGMDSYLGKPFRAEELYAAIRDADLQPVS
jgi:signal transduction histidine kinase/ActR/RegA family two-component response regulator